MTSPATTAVREKAKAIVRESIPVRADSNQDAAEMYLRLTDTITAALAAEREAAIAEIIGQLAAAGFKEAVAYLLRLSEAA